MKRYSKELYQDIDKEMKVHHQLLKRNNNKFQDVLRNGRVIVGDDKMEIMRNWLSPGDDDVLGFWSKEFDVWQEAVTYLLTNIENIFQTVHLYLGNDGPVYRTDSRLVLKNFQGIMNYLRNGYKPFFVTCERGFWGYGLDYLSEPEQDHKSKAVTIFGWQHED